MQLTQPNTRVFLGVHAGFSFCGKCPVVTETIGCSCFIRDNVALLGQRVFHVVECRDRKGGLFIFHPVASVEVIADSVNVVNFVEFLVVAGNPIDQRFLFLRAENHSQ